MKWAEDDDGGGILVDLTLLIIEMIEELDGWMVLQVGGYSINIAGDGAGDFWTDRNWNYLPVDFEKQER